MSAWPVWCAAFIFKFSMPSLREAIRHRFSPRTQKKYSKVCKAMPSNFAAIEFAKDAARIVSFSPGIHGMSDIRHHQFIVCPKLGNV